jgi:VPDSG-CTERM motif
MDHNSKVLPKNRVTRPILIGAVGLFMGLAPFSKATPITVQQIGITPYETVSTRVMGSRHSRNVRSGVNQLLVNGTLVNGFCIDPFHPSIGGLQPYDMVSLTSAPKDDHLIPGTHMTASEAETISELWALAYPLIGSDRRKAAGLQIAIWEVVGGNQFQLGKRAKDYGASPLLSRVEAPNYNGPSANLVALTGPGQDFVIDPPGQASVPDNGTTITLFGLALAALALFGRAKLEHPAPPERPV